ncbi:hypothetical protein LCGC14_0380570 [marine sediment metagenome]|uniref:Uncharacterized protein n=1 Tax=marine sediment metagenome TaxID=412755 RepID=A0A0F9VPQ1_9ZZZZ
MNWFDKHEGHSIIKLDDDEYECLTCGVEEK